MAGYYACGAFICHYGRLTKMILRIGTDRLEQISDN